MHAFALMVCSMLGHPWARALIGTAQQLAVRFTTDKVAVDTLAVEAAKLSLTVHLSPCNLSQLQSVHTCLESLLRLQTPIKQALLKYPVAMGSSEVRGFAVHDLCMQAAIFAHLLACSLAFGHQAAISHWACLHLHSTDAMKERTTVLAPMLAFAVCCDFELHLPTILLIPCLGFVAMSRHR